MYRLIASLLALILLGTLGLGFSLTVLYNSMFKQDETTLDPLPYTQTLGPQISGALDNMSEQWAEQERFITSWNLHSDHRLDVFNVDQISIPQDIMQKLRNSGSISIENDKGVRKYFHLEKSDKILSIITPNNERNSGIVLQLSFTALFYGGLLCLALLWLVPLLYQLRTLREVAMMFGKGNLKARIPLSSVSYISDIEGDFNRMADRIERLMEDVRLIGSALSHEMRTPLAKLRLGIDMLDEQEEPAARKRYQGKLSHAVDQLTALVESTLNFSRMDFALNKAEKIPVDLIFILEECISKLETENLSINFETPKSNIYISGNDFHIALMMNSLLENSVKYGNGSIIVRLECNKNYVTLSVNDNGPGFDSNSMQNILLPFQRGNSARGKTGFGLGLAVACRVAEWHGSQIKLGHSEQLSGACVTVAFKTI